MKENEIQDELASIRSLMERSSKFISLSGLSGILAGVYALIGAGVAYNLLNYNIRDFWFSGKSSFVGDLEIVALFSIAMAVLVASLVTGFILSYRKAQLKGQPIWGAASKALLFNTSVPLITGGLLLLVLIFRGYYGIVCPLSLVFYGLALISASNFTFSDVRYLGILEILLGLIAACMPGYGLLFWAFGFGVLHFLYGSVMYFKYDR